jgi:transposase
LGDDAQGFPFVQDVFSAFQEMAAFRSFSEGMADPCPTVRVLERNQLGSDMCRWLKASIKKRGEDTGPNPVDRGKSGTNIHLATDGRGMPLGAVITGANANDGQQAGDLLESLVIKPPAPEVISRDTDPRDLPSARGDGAYGNEPTRQRAEHHGFRMRAPKRGQTKIAGIGRVRSAVERGHALLCQFGRVFRRLDRLSANYLGWVQLAACVVFIRAGFFR